jgi:hypothetical protein
LQRRYVHLVQPDPSYPKYLQQTHVDDPTDWYTLLRPTQNAVALDLILQGKLEHLIKSPRTGYEYWIDMKKEVLIVCGVADDDVEIPFADFKEGLMGNLRAYGGELYRYDQEEDTSETDEDVVEYDED